MSAKNKTTVNLQARAEAGGRFKAPDKIVLWKPGKIVGDFGENLWDSEAAAQVLAEYNKRGNPIPIDIEHNTNPSANPNYDPNNPPKGGGYCWLHISPEGWLVLDPMQWSDFARGEIESGSRRAVSPDWDFDPKTKRPVRLNKVSLVQNPGTYGIGLVASAKAGGAKTMDMAMLMAALKAALTAEDPKASIQALLAEVEKASPSAPAEGLEAGSGPEDKPVAAGMSEEDKAVLAAARLLVSGTKARASAQPLPKGLTAAEVENITRKTLMEERQKDNLIASAKASPGYTDELGQELATLPLSSVKRLVAALPKPALAGQQGATASASVGQDKAKTGPLAGPATDEKKTLTPAEEAAIARIKQAGSGRDALINQARASAGKSEDGTFTFSPFAQMTPRRPVEEKKN